MNLFKFPLPDIGEGVAEGELVEWSIEVGQELKEDDVLCEVMTDKATVEIPCPMDGKVHAAHAEAGQVVPVGFDILTIEYADGAHVPTVARHGDHDDAEAEEAAPAGDQHEAVTEQIDQVALDEFVRPEGERALATPFTRKLARTLGVDIERIRGTGEIGRVTPQDVEDFVAALRRVEAMPDSGRLTIHTRESDDGEWIYIIFTDNGPGMDEQTRASIFEPFFTTKSTGTGLGLAISYGIIERHAGEIKVDSAPGAGSVFTVSLPVTDVTQLGEDGNEHGAISS